MSGERSPRDRIRSLARSIEGVNGNSVARETIEEMQAEIDRAQEAARHAEFRLAQAEAALQRATNKLVGDLDRADLVAGMQAQLAVSIGKGQVFDFANRIKLSDGADEAFQEQALRYLALALDYRAANMPDEADVFERLGARMMGL